MKNIEKELNLLPRYFRIIGFVLVAISVVLAILFFVELLKIETEIFENINGYILLLAFLLIASSKEKIEDELTLNIRLRAFAIAFIFGAGFMIIYPLMNLLISGRYFQNYGPFGILNLMFFIYFGQYYRMKKSR